MNLSVIVSTSPGRETQLKVTLEGLCQQRFTDFEVLVADDGSEGAKALCQTFASRLNLQHLWRPNDFCVSRSRNQGATAAQTDQLIFIDGDIILNPQALKNYQKLLTEQPFIYGHYGNMLSILSPSLWFSEAQVKPFDSRFLYKAPQDLRIPNTLWQKPQLYAWSGNCAFQRGIYETVGGFNETFRGWGMEDIELAVRLDKAGYPLVFSLDVWAEHLDHTLAERVFIDYQAQLDTTQEVQPARQKPRVLKPERDCNLSRHSLSHYLHKATIPFFEDSPEIQGVYGFILEAQGKVKEALKHYEMLLQYGDFRLQGQYILEVLRWTTQPAAMLDLCEHYGLNAPGLSPHQRRKMNATLAQVLKNQGHVDLAQHYYKKSLKNEPVPEVKKP